MNVTFLPTMVFAVNRACQDRNCRHRLFASPGFEGLDITFIGSNICLHNISCINNLKLSFTALPKDTFVHHAFILQILFDPNRALILPPYLHVRSGDCSDQYLVG